MEVPLNCSVPCGSGGCHTDHWVNSQVAGVVFYQLCMLTSGNWETQRGAPSLVLRAVVWTLLSCGILLTLFFLAFTVRFRNNRIVKMSSPNLNILTLCGSILTFSSGFLYNVEDRSLLPSSSPLAFLQAQIWTLCIGSSLVFGPILGKTWRLYRVFTQRVPDKRVIIRDSQLMGFVALLILADILILSAWGLSDPVQCARSMQAGVQVMEHDIVYSMFQTESCSSLYSDIWISLLSVLKGSLLLYGTYLAGLTSNVSWPPVNQSPTIVAAVCLVSLSLAVCIPTTRMLHTWPNVIYSVVSGAIFICTLATNCLLFVPQLTQWKRFEDELNPNPSQMAKYFSSPSRSLQPMYSEEDIYCLRGENNSMKRLLAEKDAVIDSLQEQVSNAKDKLIKLMSASSPLEEKNMDLSSANPNSPSTQTTELQPEVHFSLLETSGAPLLPSLSATDAKSTYENTGDCLEKPNCLLDKKKKSGDSNDADSEIRVSSSQFSSGFGDELVGDLSMAEASHPVEADIPQRTSTMNLIRGEQSGVLTKETTPVLKIRNTFVSNEQLQEVLQELCVESIRFSIWDKKVVNPSLGGASPKMSCCYHYPSISPYVMRKRRPPFRASRRGPAPYLHRACATPSQESKPEADPMDSHLQKESLGSRSIGNGEKDEEDELLEQTPVHWHHQGASRISSHNLRKEVTEGMLRQEEDPFSSSDSDSNCSADNYCYYHRSYCDSCRQRPYESTESNTSDTSDSEESTFLKYCRISKPIVNFKEDLKPTFV